MLERASLVLGRALLSVIFLLSGFGKLMHWHETVAGLAATRWPAASLLIAISMAIEIGGGLMLLFGFRVRWAALIMALWLIPVTLTFHNFWAFSGQQMQGQLINFLKNLAIMGGLLVASATAAAARRAVPAGAQR